MVTVVTRPARGVVAAPLAVAFGVLAMLAAAVALWATAAGSPGIPTTAVELAPTLSLLGALLMWRRPGNRIAALIAGTGLLFAIATLASAVLDHAARGGVSIWTQPALLVCWLASALPVPWMLLVLWFPDGRFTAATWQRLFVLAAAVAVAVSMCGYLFVPPGQLPSIISGGHLPSTLRGPFGLADDSFEPTLAQVLPVLPIVALPALVVRYRNADEVVRQQVRWLIAASAATAVGSVAATALGHGPAAAAALGIVLGAVVQPLPALAITVAVLRYRLFDIDVLVSRAAVYAVLWAGLSILLLAPALASGYLVGGTGALTAVGAALVVTLAFQPVHVRMQCAVGNWIFGPRRRAAQPPRALTRQVLVLSQQHPHRPEPITACHDDIIAQNHGSTRIGGEKLVGRSLRDRSGRRLTQDPATDRRRLTAEYRAVEGPAFRSTCPVLV